MDEEIPWSLDYTSTSSKRMPYLNIAMVEYAAKSQ